MLKPLLKHEFKATKRFFLPAYGIFAALLILERLTVLLGIGMDPDTSTLWGQLTQILFGLCTFVTVLGVYAMLFSPVVLGTIRFYRNMMTDQGYLTHTLPVTAGQHIQAKLLLAAFWSFITAIVVLLCGGVFFATLGLEEVWTEIRNSWQFSVAPVLQEAGLWLLPTVLLLLITGFVGACCNYLSIYTALSIGQTANKHKLLAAFGAYAGIQFVISFIGQSFLMLVVFSAPEHWEDSLIPYMNTLEQTAAPASIVCAFLCIVMVAAILISIALCTAYYFICRHFLSKRLNLA